MNNVNDQRVATGVEGLDAILHGGLISQRAYLVRGGPGSGKTTLGLHYLANGPSNGSLFVTLGETEGQLRADAARSGLSMEEVTVLDLSPASSDQVTGSYSLLESWDIEGNTIHDRTVEYSREHRPSRIFIDSLSQMRYLSADAFQFRKQVMSLLRTLTAGGATVLFTSETLGGEDDQALPFLSDGVINLDHTEHGRLCSVSKLRGSGFESGTHYFRLGYGGMQVHPRLISDEHQRSSDHARISCGIPEMDELTHGGIERGTVTLLSSPTGVGKTTLGVQFMEEAAGRGERSVIYSFDEGRSTFLTRCRQVGLPVEAMIESGNLKFEAVEPLHYNPDQFAAGVRAEVEERGATMVMLDSLSGYQQSIRGEDLTVRIHALGRYLVNMGVTVVLVNEVFSIMGGPARVSEYGLSYIADNIILLRYIELKGEIRKTIGILKKRAGNFERTLREFEITEEGVKVGVPMRGLRGVLGGSPEPISESGGQDERA